jgi:hypothetical protein
MDLLLPDSMRRNATGAGAGRNNEPQLPRLDIKKDPKGLVTVVGATDLSVTSEQQLLTAIEQVRFQRRSAAERSCCSLHVGMQFKHARDGNPAQHAHLQK